MLRDNYEWFKQNYQNLFKRYGFGYLVIKNLQVIGVYSSYKEGLTKTLQSEEIGTFIIQLCSGYESAYTNYISSINLA